MMHLSNKANDYAASTLRDPARLTWGESGEGFAVPFHVLMECLSWTQDIWSGYFKGKPVLQWKKSLGVCTAIKWLLDSPLGWEKQLTIINTMRNNTNVQA
jgi:hypothetical protein